MGRATRCVTGFALALERKAAIVVTMDADGQHRPEELPTLLEPVLAGDGRLRAGLARTSVQYDDAGGARDLGIRGFTTAHQPAPAARASPTARTASARSAATRSRGSGSRSRGSRPRELIMESARQGLRMREVLGAHPVAQPR